MQDLGRLWLCLSTLWSFVVFYPSPHFTFWSTKFAFYIFFPSKNYDNFDARCSDPESHIRHCRGFGVSIFCIASFIAFNKLADITLWHLLPQPNCNSSTKLNIPFVHFIYVLFNSSLLLNGDPSTFSLNRLMPVFWLHRFRFIWSLIAWLLSHRLTKCMTFSLMLRRSLTLHGKFKRIFFRYACNFR